MIYLIRKKRKTDMILITTMLRFTPDFKRTREAATDAM